MKVTRARGARRRTKLLAALAGVPLILAGTFTSPAHAASLDGMLSFDGFHVGAFETSGGARAYCLEPGMNTPFSQQQTAARVSSLPAYTHHVSDEWGWSGQVTTAEASGDTLRQMNWVLWEHGRTANAEQAVSVQIALWELRRGSGNASWIDAKLALVSANGGQALVDAGLRLADEARRVAVGPTETTTIGELEIALGDVHGAGEVSYPAGTTVLRIEGGTFADGTTEAAIEDGEAGVLEWTAALHADAWSRNHEVQVFGSWELDERYWPAELILYPPSQTNEQRLGSGVAPVSRTFGGDYVAASLVIDSRFEPTITTAVPREIVPRTDGVFSDTVSVGTVEPGTPWPARSGAAGGAAELFPLTAHGTLYGPFNAPQVEQASPPPGAPVAARSTIAIDRGPGEYGVETAATGLESGYYYWVWEIREDAQTDAVRASELIAPGSVYADGFGVRSERQSVPMELRWVTQLSQRVLTPEARVLEDQISVSLHAGAWLRDDAGERIPARIRFTIYQTDTEPVRQAAPSDDATIIGTVFADVTVLDTWVDAPPFEVPSDVQGWITIQACLFEEDQDEELRGHIAEWCDDFGVPEETAQILAPEVPDEPEPPIAPVTNKTPPTPLAQTGGIPGAPAVLLGTGTLMLGALLYWGSRRRSGTAAAPQA